MLQALDAVVRGGALARVVEFSRDRAIERVDQQRRLASAGDAGNASEQAQRYLGRDVLQIVAARVHHLDGAAMVGWPALGYLDGQVAGEILPRQRIRILHDVGGRTLRDDMAA